MEPGPTGSWDSDTKGALFSADIKMAQTFLIDFCIVSGMCAQQGIWKEAGPSPLWAFQGGQIKAELGFVVLPTINDLSLSVNSVRE